VTSLGFMTVALGKKYEQYVGPYIASTLLTYPQATCEIRVSDPDAFHTDYKHLITGLRGLFADRFLIAAPQIAWRRKKLIPNTVRFVIEPLLCRPAMLYIGDVDIIVSQPGIVEFHSEAMKTLKLPYSNVIRTGKQRLTGLHVIRTKEYFAKLPQPVRETCIAKWPKINDERFLYRMCHRYIGLPRVVVERPTFGVHPSLQRPIFRSDGCHWGVDSHLQTHLALIQSEEWKAIFPFFRSDFRQKMQQVQNWIDRQR
jgi:hypothetical protein